jgi:hypothetical protein
MRAISSLVVTPGMRAVRVGGVVAQIVQPQPSRRAAGLAGRPPGVGDTGRTGRLAPRAGEHHSLRSGLGVDGEVMVQRLDHHGRRREDR